MRCNLYIRVLIKDDGPSDHPILARLASASGKNDVRDFWSSIDVGVDL